MFMHFLGVSRGKKFKGIPAAPGNAVSSSKSSTTDKLNKGLRHFSWRVCEKVQQKKVTSYNEVSQHLLSFWEILLECIHVRWYMVLSIEILTLLFSQSINPWSAQWLIVTIRTHDIAICKHSCTSLVLV